MAVAYAQLVLKVRTACMAELANQLIGNQWFKHKRSIKP